MAACVADKSLIGCCPNRLPSHSDVAAATAGPFSPGPLLHGPAPHVISFWFRGSGSAWSLEPPWTSTGAGDPLHVCALVARAQIGQALSISVIGFGLSPKRCWTLLKGTKFFLLFFHLEEKTTLPNHYRNNEICQRIFHLDSRQEQMFLFFWLETEECLFLIVHRAQFKVLNRQHGIRPLRGTHVLTTGHIKCEVSRVATRSPWLSN